jgi:ParB family transcriptional regulator, chromosome partitioning protein
VDEQVTGIMKRLQERGFKSPYLRPFVVARVNPVRWLKLDKKATKPPMTVPEALTRMTKSLRDFAVEKVKPQDLALVAAVAPSDDGE